MRIPGAFTALLFALCCANTVAGRAALHRRQDPANTSVASTTASPATTDQPTTTQQQSSSPTTSQTSTDKGNGKTKAHSTSTTLTTSKSQPTPTGHHNATSVEQHDKLPIQPTITPALGVVGVVLIITGVLFSIGGIRHQWIVVFFSAAYLTALAVTVLIIYVMTPPVSDAIQGAYMVAALLTGLIFGGISLVFKEVTEGLGCLLGGFCLSMWFLVLRDGGLIQSTTGRAIMIGVFSAVGWSLSFSQYTRNYGLIICTAFSGAMITILGIDCFSRAGLKEFWLYIWALNKDIFPINTHTYPITRGIRVEIAGTVVLFLFGVMSQIKIWKIVRERKAKNEAAREAAAERREQRDSAIGKKVEARNGRSLAQWEAVYGNKDKNKGHEHTDSGVGTSLDGDPKTSASVAEREVRGIEMADMGGVTAKRTSKGFRNSVLVRTESDEVPFHGEFAGMDMNPDPEERMWWEDYQSRKSQSKPGTARSVDESSLVEMLPKDRPPVPGGPSVVPLPFSPTTNSKDGEVKSDAAVDANAAATQDKPVNERRGVALNKLALESLNQAAPPKRIDDDRASSVAATADDDFDTRSTNRKSLAPTITIQPGGLSPFSDHFRDTSRSPPRSPRTPSENPIDENDDEILVRSPPRIVEPDVDSKGKSSKKRVSIDSRRRSTGSVGAEGDNEDAASIHSLTGHLPESISKVAMAYRTNEWAKHIADAEQPEYEPMPEVEVDEAGVQVEVGRPVEVPRALDPVALAETAPPADPMVSTNPSFRQSKTVEYVKPRKTSAPSPTPVYAFSQGNSKQLTTRSSNGSLNQAKREMRSSSSPFAQPTLVESPIEDDSTATSPYQHFSTPPTSTNNLLDERNTRISRRTTTTSFNALAAASADPNAASSTTLDNIPLSDRKTVLQSTLQPTSQTSSAIARATPTPPLGRVNSTNNPALIYDSHQPRRSNTVDAYKQTAMLTQWRQSLQQENTPHPTLVNEEQARLAMLSQRERAGYKRQRDSQRRQTRDSMRDVAMRTGQLTSAHQEAMRRMQAKANLDGKGE